MIPSAARSWLVVAILAIVLATPSRAQSAPGIFGARSFKSGPIQITADGRWVWSVNPDNDSVARLDAQSEQLTEFPLPAGQKHAPKGISVKEDGSEVWVACHDSDRIYVLSGTNGSILATIELPWGSGPYSVAISPDQKRALVTLHRAEAAAAIDVSSRGVVKIVHHLFWAPMGIAWTEGGSAAWINHIFAPGEHPLQTRIEWASGEPRVTTSMRITPADPRQGSNLSAPYAVPEGGYLNIRGHGAQIPAASGRNELWLPTQYHNFNTDSYSADSTMQSAVRHIDLGTRKLLHENKDKVVLSAKYTHVAANGGAYQGAGWDAHVAGPVDLGFSADGKMVYVLHELSGDLVSMRTDTPAVKPASAAPLPETKVGDRPIGLALSPTEGKAFVNNLLSRDISIVDLEALRETKRVPATPITGEPFAASVLLGAKIFHSSDDPRISANAKVACASCHINGEHDGRKWGFDKLPGKHGPRDVPSMLGLRQSLAPRQSTNDWGQLHSSGDRDEIQDFEHTFQNIQMKGTGFLGAAVKPELGEPNAGLSPELDALASYLFSLDPLPRSPRRAADGKLSEAAMRGATFFTGGNRAQKRGDAGCAACHVPETGFVDFKFHDVGQRRDPNEKELNSRAPAWNVNTLTLVGLWATPPYAGMAEFAEAHSAEGAMIGFLLDSARRANNANHHGKPDGLTWRQLRDLAEFVLSIDGNMTAEEARSARDTDPPRIVRAEVTALSRIDVWFNETVQEQSARDSANWRLAGSDGEIPIVGIVWDSVNGDRVTITAQLRPHATFALAAVGPILDEAGIATGGISNALDPAAAENRRELKVTDRLTITLGGSSAENLAIPVHDTAMVSPGLSTWSHDSVWLAASGGTPRSTTGFIRFGWQNFFRAAAGVTNASQILDASFSVQAEFGNGQQVEARRVLQRWSDPATGNDWNSGATGAPTWRDSAHPTKRWNAAGAGRLGSLGTSTADYNGANDLASRVDALADASALNERTEFAGPLITEAFRFWFDNPSVDYGYALRLVAAQPEELKFERTESGMRDGGPVLKLTYLIPGARPRLEAFHAGDKVRLQWPADLAGWILQSSPAATGAWANVTAAQTTGTNRADLDLAGAQRFFRLALP